jgi:hypothetical protein
MKTRIGLLLMMALAAPAAARAQSYTEVLQRAIYLQETRGDLEGAIRLYRQIASEAPPASDARAQALRRLQALQMARPSGSAVANKRSELRGRTYRHGPTGVSLELPEGWEYRGTGPSSDDGDMVELSASDPAATVLLWLIPEQNDWDGINRRLDSSPELKVESRIANGRPDYHLRAGSRHRTTIGGNQAIVAIGDFTSDGQPMEEYLVWIYTEKTHTFFFSAVPAGQLTRLKPLFDGMLSSAIIP